MKPTKHTIDTMIPITTKGSVVERDARLLLEGAATFSGKRRRLGIGIGAIAFARGETREVILGKSILVKYGEASTRLNEAYRYCLDGGQSEVQVAQS
jgi:hypothetical protein